MEDMGADAHEMNEKRAEQAGHRWDAEKRAWVKDEGKPSVRPRSNKGRDEDVVTEASKESFPASDPPGFNG